MQKTRNNRTRIIRAGNSNPRVLIAEVRYLFLSVFAGAFVIPFLIMMLLEGMPLLLLELGIGQKMRTGSLGVWNRVHPYLGGIGLGSTVIAVVVGCYYNMIIAWCLFYLYYSMRVSFFFYFFE